MHQFRDAGLIVENPDQVRPTNSGKFAYRIEPMALELLRSFGGDEWEKALATYLASRETLSKRYAQAREMRRIPVKLGGTTVISLSSSGHNVLMKAIVEDFAARFTPGGQVLYIGDTDEKFAHFDGKGLADLGARVERHGKMPDVVIYYPTKKWLVLIEAVTSHGPVDPKRREELRRLFAGSSAGLVLVTAFADRRAMQQYLREISWETEVWVADAPDHLIHFNGERYLGPY